VSDYRILLVDDDPFFLEVYGEFLRSRSFRVETASSGEQALELFAPGRYQLVVADLIMPGLSGIELIERVRTQSPAQDIIVVTGSDDVRTAVRAMRLGVYDYLTKPVEREELVLVIDRLQERATLYDEHARLLHENILYAEVQQIFQRAMHVMSTLDLETVCERLLETLSEICGAQGAIVWLMREDIPEAVIHGYRGLVDANAAPMTWDPAQTAAGRELVRGLPVSVNRDLTRLVRLPPPSESLLVSLAREGRLIGVVQLVGKLGGGFDGRDAAHAKVIGDCAATAVLHSRRFRQLERVGLRDPTTSAYNMTYFVDYLGRELHKARRYTRSFAVVLMSLDNLQALKQALRPEVYPEALRRITLAVSSVLRDVDVLARVKDDEMYLLLPETDFLGGLTFARAARDAIARSPFLAEIDRQHPIAVSFGPAAFPRDGDDVDQLFAACSRRLEEARRSLFRRLHLEDVDFWSAVELLIGDPARYQGDQVDTSAGLAAAEDARGVSRHHVFPPGFVPVVRGEVLGEMGRQATSGGWLYLGSDWAQGGVDLADQLKRLPPVVIEPYVLGSDHPPRLRQMSGITTVRVDSGAVDDHEVVLLLAEHASYGLLAKRRADGRAFGFHTADWTLVEGMIGKLQEAYNLQKGGNP
jgi:diguanylate cyclase (GGDEF)-like protein